ncbi:torsin-1A isoform X1 [Salmo salar]|uniref:Torsin-1A isoform X1 n=1 Tax=Salmo salar TaxID=8030 RepID=A0ABM3DT90_SALSA|nr:torsin-1A isoform X1 [Salmo salar]XP_045562013.1 torsin-1A isoform X1 [Salmo salar]XP_045562014.1 torsin-1A isoform X1 [Salmo salar]XP_045562015.1 torsin-1A isoform X1 [Salmo salar]XP_045562016.1 torsin-1A isoform X1 [Salmo salar]XP_045562017.1 torsin-1A isoform X1 [Salmo salar]XP_045562018.1 torsin-1A isoform X1 [Salmo salar]XP_045562019.1 torsin-1A isoform X1 [Salmo salar]XP_045562020.1 torsin-1A isoform X1 [Salmo salar]XP_045562021.1 torsin-1A isoform X1 [Salmo salar]XP_045562022.1 
METMWLNTCVASFTRMFVKGGRLGLSVSFGDILIVCHLVKQHQMVPNSFIVSDLVEGVDSCNLFWSSKDFCRLMSLHLMFLSHIFHLSNCKIPTRDLWAGFPQDYIRLLSQWYCSLGQCCESGDCRIINNITGLASDLQLKLHGQHLAQSVVLKAVQGFISNPESNKPLTLSFHGWSGTGKNFVARIVADNMYRDGVKSECVRLFIAPFHFPHARLVDTYKGQLREAIRDMVLRCPQTLFIFDEAEKLHPGLIDAIKPYMDHYDNVDGVSYRRAVFLFLSNIGGTTINDVALDFWHSGQNREDIGMEDLEHRLRAEAMESQGGFAQSELMSGHLIDFFVPFLPLEYRHVKLCARDAYAARGLEPDEGTLDEVAKAMLYVPKEERLFSAQGCKSIPQRINFFLP